MLCIVSILWLRPTQCNCTGQPTIPQERYISKYTKKKAELQCFELTITADLDTILG